MPLEDEYCRIKNEADVLVIDMPISSFKYRAIFLLQNEGYGILCIMIQHHNNLIKYGLKD